MGRERGKTGSEGEGEVRGERREVRGGRGRGGEVREEEGEEGK